MKPQALCSQKAETSVSSDSGDEFMDVSETPHEETPHVVDSNAWHQNVPAVRNHLDE